MERKQGFFSALKEEVVRGLSPGRSRSRSRSRSESPRRDTAASPMSEFQLPRRRWWRGHQHQHQKHQMAGDLALPRSGSLAPVMEGPEAGEEDAGSGWDSRRERRWGQWMTGPLTRAPSLSGNAVAAAAASSSCRRSDIRLLLGVMGAPLAPFHVCSAVPFPHLSIKDTPIETSSAQYILQQYIAASGGLKLLRSIRNSYATGKIRMVAAQFETATRIIKNRHTSTDAESGSFVLWQMAPEMWYVELAVGGSKVHAGCNGKLVWRHTPWLGSHAAKGPVRPLRRALQGLDPLTTASMFANAQCIGEKNMDGEDCFILKLCADHQTLKARSEGSAEIIRHVLFGYFSQRTGLLIHMEDSHLTRIQSSDGGDAVYWETTINSFIHDYRPVEGLMVAHSGRSIVTLFRFGEVAMSHSKSRMEETWTIEEVAFNVPGLSMDCFIPPADIKCRSISEACELSHGEGRNNVTTISNRAKVAALEKPQTTHDNNILWRVEI